MACIGARDAKNPFHLFLAGLLEGFRAMLKCRTFRSGRVPPLHRLMDDHDQSVLV
jgi:hypothetical protein